MRVARDDSVTVIEFNNLSVAIHIARKNHGTQAGAVDRAAVSRVHIEPGMERFFVIDRIDTGAVIAPELILIKRRRKRQILRQLLQLLEPLMIERGGARIAQRDIGPALAGRAATQPTQETIDIEPCRSKQSLELGRFPA